jgi:hypothetical protein
MYRLADFYQLSVVLTDYNQVQLQSTGVGEEYCQTLTQWVRQDVLEDLYNCFNALPTDAKGKVCDKALRSELLASAKLGPVARNIIKMWYLSIWYQLGSEWNFDYGIAAYSSPVIGVESAQSQDYIISSNAYIQGLVWPALGSHPMGAKQPGYGTWAQDPRLDINEVNLQ